MNTAIITNPTQKAKSRLRDDFSRWMKMKGKSDNTIRDYINDVLAFVLFSGQRDPRNLGGAEVKAFLTHLAADKNVSWKTQSQNLCALVLFYDHFLQQPLGDIGEFVRAMKPPKLPVVFSAGELQRMIDALSGRSKIIGMIQGGASGRIKETICLRVKDVDFERGTIHFIDFTKGKDRYVPMPECLRSPLHHHLASLKARFDADGGWLVSLPDAYGLKNKGAERDWIWQYIFAARDLTPDPKDGRLKRWHIFEKTQQDAVRKALAMCGIWKKASTHTFRHTYATLLLEAGYSIYDLQKLLGHSRIETTMIYNHVASPVERRIPSPLDFPANNRHPIITISPLQTSRIEFQNA
jgi:integron integrase